MLVGLCCVVVLSILFLGCASINIESNKETGYNSLLERIAIIADTGDFIVSVQENIEPGMEASYIHIRMSKYIANNLSNKLAILGIESKPIVEGELELSSNSIPDAIASYKPKHVLTVELTDGTTYGRNILSSGSFDVSLVDISLNRRVWRAAMTIQALSEFGIQSRNIMQMLDSLIAKMQEDEIILSILPK